MSKKTIILLLLGCILLSVKFCFADERRIVTYYPSPTGNYDNFTATTIIGEKKSETDTPREWATGREHTNVGPFDRVTGANADYLDGSSIEEYCVVPEDGNVSSLCYPMPIIEFEGVELFGIDLGVVYFSVCPLPFSYVKNIAYMTENPFTISGLKIWGVFWCCNYRPTVLQCGANYIEKTLICLACVLTRDLSFLDLGCDSCDYSDTSLYPDGVGGLVSCVFNFLN